jgi:uncharacterized protein (TIGR02117 family)
LAAPAFRALAQLIWRFCACLALAAGSYSFAGWIGSALPRNAGWHEPERGVEIFVETNGVHTAIVMPLATPQKDWQAEFPASDVAVPNGHYTHISVSWGEREVFLHTPTWANLSPITVLRIVLTGGQGVLHVAHYVRPAPDATMRPLRLSEAGYTRLVRRIELEIPPQAGRRIYRGYGRDDVFYDGLGHYTVFRTCNQWTSDMLAAAGVRTGQWTPFAGGVMKWVPPAAHPDRRGQITPEVPEERPRQSSITHRRTPSPFGAGIANAMAAGRKWGADAPILRL